MKATAPSMCAPLRVVQVVEVAARPAGEAKRHEGRPLGIEPETPLVAPAVDVDLAAAGHLALAGRHAAAVIAGGGDLVADVGRADVVVVAAPRGADAEDRVRTSAVVVDCAEQPVVAGGGAGLELVGWTQRAGAGALLLDVALAGGDPADGAARREGVGRTVGARAGAVLRRVAGAGRGATFEAAWPER